MKAATATETLEDDSPSAVMLAARPRVVARFPSALTTHELDDAITRLPSCDITTERWESVVFLVLALGGVVAIALAVFNAF